MVNILLVDDDDVAREGVRRGLKRAGAEFALTMAEDGREAIEILRGANPTKQIANPLLHCPRIVERPAIQRMRHQLRPISKPV